MIFLPENLAGPYLLATLCDVKKVCKFREAWCKVFQVWGVELGVHTFLQVNPHLSKLCIEVLKPPWFPRVNFGEFCLMSLPGKEF